MSSKYITLYEERSEPYRNGFSRLPSSKKRRFKREEVLSIIIKEWEFASLEEFLDNYDDSHVEYLRNYIGIE